MRKLGSIQERKNHAKMVCLVGRTKKEDEKRRMEELHQLRVSQMIMSADGSAALLHKITKPTAWRRGAQILKKEEEDVRLSDRCEANKKEWAKHWQCDERVQNMEDKPRKMMKLKKLEEVLPRLKERDLEKVSRLYKDQTGVGCDGFHPNSSSWTQQKRNERRNRGVLGEGGTEWQMAAASLHNDVVFDSEQCHK